MPRPSRKKVRSVDPHVLYQRAVQEPDAEVDFVDRTFRKLRRRKPTRLREDFCGTAGVCCSWVNRRRANRAVGLDIDAATLEWARTHNVAKLKPAAAERVTLLKRDVRRPGRGTSRMDAVLAMNFSWWVFKTREELKGYFRAVRRSLVRDGVFYLDIFGGWEAMREMRERRPIPGGVGMKTPFTYIWDQAKYDPITGHYTCHIHFTLRDGTRIRRAFTYDWRLWTIPEVREVLADAGFRRTTVYWEGDDGRGGGDGVFSATERGEACAAFVAYIVAER